jgi:hypothetical protein
MLVRVEAVAPATRLEAVVAAARAAVVDVAVLLVAEVEPRLHCWQWIPKLSSLAAV